MKTIKEKQNIVQDLVEKIQNSQHMYLADISGLNAEVTGTLRRKCYEKEVKLVVTKNTLLKRVFDQFDENLNELYDLLDGPTSIMLSDTGNVPAKLIKEFRKEHDRPILKGAYVEEAIYKGDDQLETLTKVKSKDELIGDLIYQLQSPMNNVMSALQSGSNILTGVLKTLSDKEE